MPDFARRGAVHVIVIALIVAALAPQAVAATPSNTSTERLLAAVEASTASAFTDRGTTSQRSLATLTSTAAAVPAGTEQFHPAGVALPPSVAMQATIVVPRVQAIPAPSGPATISGTASWYCCTMNWGSAAVVALPIALGGHYYAPPGGGWVTVCADRCARLPIGDACGCHWGQVGQKVVDLSPAAWAAVTDKDRYVYGIVAVTLYLE
ncbi:MAG TPA: hypothetical protein VJ839_06730 [Candidatus Limnocylindria bacterium]|nr:hypothetical protein [Candidatus Limnocylindria bacterium]